MTSLPAPPSVSSPSPPFSVSLPPPPSRTFSRVFPLIRLSNALPLPLIATVPVSVRTSISCPAVRV
ncbi:MAG: hypothetical protein C0484_03160 [Rhodospirillum sp.]|nr:hypothetical protein [Rhodospirillum sp.]